MDLSSETAALAHLPTGRRLHNGAGLWFELLSHGGLRRAGLGDDVLGLCVGSEGEAPWANLWLRWSGGDGQGLQLLPLLGPASGARLLPTSPAEQNGLGATVAGEMSQNIDRPTPSTYIGTGKVQELKTRREELRLEVAIVARLPPCLPGNKERGYHIGHLRASLHGGGLKLTCGSLEGRCWQRRKKKMDMAARQGCRLGAPSPAPLVPGVPGYPGGTGRGGQAHPRVWAGRGTGTGQEPGGGGQQLRVRRLPYRP